VAPKKDAACKRPYSLGKRLERSDQKRAKILAVLRKQLESRGFSNLTLEGLAQESSVTRQTIYNLFATRTGLLEALFDEIAIEGGIQRMRNVMQAENPKLMLSGFIEIFSAFWAKDRLLMRRIHGIAAIDPEFGAVVEARNKRRMFAATRVIEMLNQRSRTANGGKDARIAVLHALTSFEFFDAFAESCGSIDEAARLLPEMIERALNIS
jgi:AcrR family transcriptional regulator